MKNIVTFIGAGTFMAFVPSMLQAETAPNTISGWVEAAQQASGISSWWQRKNVVADVKIVFGGQTTVDATFTFEANGPRAKMVSRDGTTVVFDGKMAYTTGEPDPKARFNVLTWPWFISAPFKMKGEGITLSELDRKKIADQEYVTIRQTFGTGMGDAPDDWYRFFIDPVSKRLEWMQYIVTYGKAGNKEVDHSSVIHYHDFETIDGVQMAMRYTFYLWDDVKNQPQSEPKGTGTVRNVKFLEASPDDFYPPAGAKEIPLP